MPTTPQHVRARSSSIGPAARRGPQKAHIPFRADDLEHGKKTGLQVAYVEHKSDEFEPFSEIMMQADGKTPVGRGGKGKKRKSVQQDDGEVEGSADEDGEMSMELDHSTASPLTYFNTQMDPPSPHRVGHRSRPIGRASGVDFDSVPSPRSSSSFRQSQSQSNGRAGPSRLGRSIGGDGANVRMDHDGGEGGFDDNYDPPENEVSPEAQSHAQPQTPRQKAQRTPRRRSFSAMDQGDDGKDTDDNSEVEVEKATSPALSSFVRREPTSNGKARARPTPSPSPVPASDDLPQDYQHDDPPQEPPQEHDYEMGIEDDIAQGLQDVERAPRSNSDSEEERPVKKAKTAKGKGKEKQGGKVTKGKENGNGKGKGKGKSRERRVVEVPGDGDASPPPPGVRRGLRHRYRPLDWWRQERVVYGRRTSGGVAFVPHIKEIIRIPQEPPRPLGKHAQGKRKRSKSVASGRGKSESRGEGVGEGGEGLMWNPEEGWDDDTDPTGIVLDYITREEVSRRIAYTAKMVKPVAAANSDWFYHKIFGDGEFIAAGQLVIPPKGMKPSKSTKDNTYIFYVIEGAVNLKVHETTMILATGAMFLVPRGNTYFIENVGERDAKIFFTQARKVMLDEDEDMVNGVDDAEGPGPRRRSSSAGANSRRVSSVGQRSSSTAAPSGGLGGEKARRALSTYT